MKKKTAEIIASGTTEEQKQLLADTLAGSVLPLIENVLRQRTRQWVDVIHTQLTTENVMSLQETEKECAANAVAPRVSLSDIESNIDYQLTFTLDKASEAMGVPTVESFKLMTVCALVMKNGFVFIGKSAPASAANFNAELGAKLAYEDAIRQIWPMMGFALREKLAQAA